MGHKRRQPQENGRVFFRVILPFILQQKQLSLPLKFARKYGDDLCKVVKLRVANGYVWNVKLMKEKNAIFLAGSGLNEFFQYYSLRYGHFLVFKYKGMSDFNVRIFDKTTCEIEYPKHEKDKKQVDKSVEIFDSNMYPNSSKQHNRKRKIYKRKDEPRIVKSLKFDHKVSRMPRGTQKAAALAMNSKPKNPSFVILMTKAFILNNNMFVASAFSSRYMRSAYKQDEIKVEDCKGGEWIVRTKFIWRGDSLCLEGGWGDFRSDNCLEEGDVCLFELVRMHYIVLKVSIFRCVQ